MRSPAAPTESKSSVTETPQRSHPQQPIPSAPAPAPAGDRDADGILDAADACPDLPEDLDQFEDDDGCPDRDNDRDGIPDAHEWTGTRWTNCDLMIENGVTIDCRNRPEDHDGFRDEDGCPDLSCHNCPAPLLDPLPYDPKALRFAAADLDRLAQIVEQLHKQPGLRVWITGHTGQERDRKRAIPQSQAVADAIRDELIRRGAPGDRLTAVAAGDDIPRDTNRTAEGRRNNFRVEISGRDDSAIPSRAPTTCL